MARKVGVNVVIGADTKEFSTKMQNVRRTMKQTSGALKKFALPMAGAIAGVGIAAVKAASDMEQLGVRLKTAFQGNEQAAKSALAEINEFTAKTPFQLEQVSNGFIQLKVRGLDPSMESMRAIGDMASAMGKDFETAVQAVAQATVGEMEMLKQFGIVARQQGDQVKFTFRGVTTTVGKNSKEIQDYLMNLSRTNFAGAMEEQSKTLAGVISTLKDNVKLLAASFGEILLPLIKGVASMLQSFVDKVVEVRDRRRKLRGTEGEEGTSERYKSEYLAIRRVIVKEFGSIEADITEIRKKSDRDRLRNLRTALRVSRAMYIRTRAEEIRESRKLLEDGPLGKSGGGTGGGTGGGFRKRDTSGIFSMAGRGVQSVGQGIQETKKQIGEAVPFIQAKVTDLGAHIGDATERMREGFATMADMLQSSLIPAFDMLGTKVGEALVSGGFKNGEVGKELVGMISQLASQLANQLATMGAGLLLVPGMQGQGAAMLAGAALMKIAAGAAGAASANIGRTDPTNGAAAFGGSKHRIEIGGVVRGTDLMLITNEYSQRRR